MKVEDLKEMKENPQGWQKIKREIFLIYLEYKSKRIIRYINRKIVKQNEGGRYYYNFEYFKYPGYIDTDLRKILNEIIIKDFEDRGFKVVKIGGWNLGINWRDEE